MSVLMCGQMKKINMNIYPDPSSTYNSYWSSDRNAKDNISCTEHGRAISVSLSADATISTSVSNLRKDMKRASCGHVWWSNDLNQKEKSASHDDGMTMSDSPSADATIATSVSNLRKDMKRTYNTTGSERIATQRRQQDS